MKKLLILCIISLFAINAGAVERKPINEVNTDIFTSETQTTFSEAGDSHMAIAWWIPSEFWESLFARDETMSEFDREQMLDVLSNVSLLAIVQADISTFGAFNYYTQAEVEKKMVASYTAANGKRHKLPPMHTISPDLEVVLGMFKPVLSSAMGNLGSNMHFFVVNDKPSTSTRLIDPYHDGIIAIQLMKRNGETIHARIETPLNSLFIPRKCPNGKDAHVSWKYCPWSGERLAD
jgi:hypothetical protein